MQQTRLQLTQLTLKLSVSDKVMHCHCAHAWLFLIECYFVSDAHAEGCDDSYFSVTVGHQSAM